VPPALSTYYLSALLHSGECSSLCFFREKPLRVLFVWFLGQGLALPAPLSQMKLPPWQMQHHYRNWSALLVSARDQAVHMHECTNNFPVYGVLGNPIAPVLYPKTVRCYPPPIGRPATSAIHRASESLYSRKLISGIRYSRKPGFRHRTLSGTRDSGSTEGLGHEQFTDLNGKRLVDTKASNNAAGHLPAKPCRRASP
jgi:hypothetical protein